MKLKSLLLGLAAAALALSVSCERDIEQDLSEQTPSISLSTTSDTLFFSKEAGSVDIQVQSNREWKVLADTTLTWLMVEVNGLDAKTNKTQASFDSVTATIAVQPNSGYERIGAITFNGGTRARKTIYVKQAGGVSYTTVAEIRSMWDTSKDTVTIPDGKIVKGVVVSSQALDNLSSTKTMYFQDATGGINIWCNAKHAYAFGTELTIDLSGQKIITYGGYPEITGLVNANITAGSVTTPQPLEVDEADFFDNLLSKYEGRYVTLPEVMVASSDTSLTWCKDANTNTSINMVTKSGRTFVVRSSKYSYDTYGKNPVPTGSGPINGIASYYNGDIQLIFAQTSDYASLTGARFEVTPSETSSVDDAIKLSSGYVKVNGRVIAAATAGFVINDGTLNNLFVEWNQSSVSKGDLVTVVGSVTKYKTCVRVKATSVSAFEGSVSASPQQDVTDVAESEVAAFSCGGSAVRVSVCGTLSTETVSGIKYYDLDFLTFTKPKGSVYTSEDLDSYLGKRVKVTGYYAGSTSNFFMVVAETVEEDTAPYFILGKDRVNASAADTSASFSFTTNQAWTASATGSLTLDPTSGSGSETVRVSFPANESEDAVDDTISIVTAAGTYTVIFHQSGIGGAESVTLTNEEIVAFFKTQTQSTSNYVDCTIESESGTWTGNMCGKKDLQYVQMRNKQLSCLKTPLFQKDIDRLEFSVYVTVSGTNTNTRSIYAMPMDTDLTKGLDSNNLYTTGTTLASNLGNVSFTGVANTEYKGAIDVSGSQKQLMLVAGSGAIYIRSITVYFK